VGGRATRRGYAVAIASEGPSNRNKGLPPSWEAKEAWTHVAVSLPCKHLVSCDVTPPFRLQGDSYDANTPQSLADVRIGVRLKISAL